MHGRRRFGADPADFLAADADLSAPCADLNASLKQKVFHDDSIQAKSSRGRLCRDRDGRTDLSAGARPVRPAHAAEHQ
ncbi:hypothetical protein D3C72_2286750 [compost metagenome]